MTQSLRSAALLLLALGTSVGAAAQTVALDRDDGLLDPNAGLRRPRVAAEPGTQPVRGLELYQSHQRLSNGFDNWNETGLRGLYQTGQHLWLGELATMRRYGERGRYAAVSDTVTISPDWFGSLAVGAGDGVHYLPRYRVDGFLNRKLLAARNLIGTIGAGYYRAPDGHIDRNINVGGTYYFEQPFVLQGEVRFNHGSPGDVRTRQQFLALTYGRDKTTQMVARYGWGREGYQALGEGATIVNFASHDASVNVRHWLGRAWGVDVGLERYTNPYYRRDGLTATLFWQVP